MEDSNRDIEAMPNAFDMFIQQTVDAMCAGVKSMAKVVLEEMAKLDELIQEFGKYHEE